MDTLTSLRQAEELLSSVCLSLEQQGPAGVPSVPHTAASAFERASEHLLPLDDLTDPEQLFEGRELFKQVKVHTDRLNSYIAHWISAQNAEPLAEPALVKNVNTAQVARSWLPVRRTAQSLSHKMAIAAEFREVRDVFTSINSALSECDAQLTEIEAGAAGDAPSESQVQIPDSASPQAPIFGPKDVGLNEKLTSLRRQTQALHRSLQYVPLRVEGLEKRARPVFAEAYEELSAKFAGLEAAIHSFSYRFDHVDQELTHDKWLPIIAQSNDPRVRNYAKIRGFCEPSPEKQPNEAIALFRGVSRPRSLLSKPIPIMLPTSPPQLSLESDDHSTTASFDDSAESDFFASSPLHKKHLKGSILEIPKRRKPRKSQIARPTEIVRGQTAPALAWRAPVPKPRPNSQVQRPTAIRIRARYLHHRIARLKI